MANKSVRADEEKVYFLYLIVTSNRSSEAPDIPLQAMFIGYRHLFLKPMRGFYSAQTKACLFTPRPIKITSYPAN